MQCVIFPNCGKYIFKEFDLRFYRLYFLKIDDTVLY